MVLSSLIISSSDIGIRLTWSLLVLLEIYRDIIHLEHEILYLYYNIVVANITLSFSHSLTSLTAPNHNLYIVKKQKYLLSARYFCFFMIRHYKWYGSAYHLYILRLLFLFNESILISLIFFNSNESSLWFVHVDLNRHQALWLPYIWFFYSRTERDITFSKSAP